MAAVGKRGVYVFIPRDSDVWLYIIKAIDSAAATATAATDTDQLLADMSLRI